MNNNYLLGNNNFISSEKVFLRNIAVTALCCSSVIPLLPKENKTDFSYSINPTYDVSYSSQDFLSSHAKDYNLLLMRIDEIQSLKENWNGYGANTIPFSVINSAKNFIFYIKDLSEFISVFPTARQSIQIEFDRNGIYCEAEIFSDAVDIYAEKDDVEYKNEQFNSVVQAFSSFRNLFNVRVNH
ncbi:MAG: hypothetical protein WAX77_15725 [Methylococcaceae bacterium]